MTDPIKTKIQELCPDVMELKFGCEIKTTKGYYVTLIEHRDGWYTWKIHEDGTIGGEDHCGLPELILGSPITLAVVLRAIGQMVQGKRHIVVNMIGGFAEYKSANGEMGLWMLAGGHMWNLEHDNYDDQDRPTQLFIGSLLGV